MEIEEDLGEIIYMVDFHKRMCVGGTPKEEGATHKPQMACIFMLQKTLGCGKCGRRELPEFQR